MKLTKKNYFSKNRYLTNSKIGDYIKDKQFFYKKHILGEIKSSRTEAMLYGSAVDCWITHGEKVFMKEYQRAERRNLKNPPKGYTELSASVYDDVVALCQKLEKTSAIAELKGFTRQRILTVEGPVGQHFDGLAGIPDWYQVKGKKAVVVDLKTCDQARDTTKFHWHCLTYGYYRQQAFYQMLIAMNHPEVEEFEHFILAVEKDSDKIFNSYTFVLDKHTLEREKRNILDNILPEISLEQAYLPADCSFKTARLLGSNI